MAIPLSVLPGMPAWPGLDFEIGCGTRLHVRGVLQPPHLEGLAVRSIAIFWDFSFASAVLINSFNPHRRYLMHIQKLLSPGDFAPGRLVHQPDDSASHRAFLLALMP